MAAQGGIGIDLVQQCDIHLGDILVFLHQPVVVLSAHVVVGDDELQHGTFHVADGEHAVIEQQTDEIIGVGERVCGEGLVEHAEDVSILGYTVYDDTVRVRQTTTGTFGILDFSPFTQEGEYWLTCNGLKTDTFHISQDAFRHAEELLLNFIFCQRCGYAVPGIHGICHTDVFCTFKGEQTPYGGGWHDAGDLSQQTLQTCETAYSLLEAWQKIPDKHSALASRLLEEAEWGLRFVLRCRLGNGYHASSIGLLHWTDGIVGTADDIFTVRSQDMAYDNFLYAACEAYAARTMPPSSLRDSLAQAAAEDFRYALHKFRRNGQNQHNSRQIPAENR